MDVIKGEALPLHKIFSSEFDFVIPPYQRPYAWTVNETAELFDDLYTFWKDKDGGTQYFLGSIVLSKDDLSSTAEVIDGQQRLTTLTILLSVLAAEFTPHDADIEYYINEPGHGILTKPHPRLIIRKRDNDFFRKYIQGIDIDGLLQVNPDNQDTEAKKNIILNAVLLRSRIRDNLPTQAEIMDFVKFIVAISTPARDTAFRVFSVLNSRGMDLLPTDILKSDIVGAITDSKEQDDYNQHWEDTENDIGRSEFPDLFSAMRMIYVKAKARKSVIDEFRKIILPNITDSSAKHFIDDVLVPYAEAFMFVCNPHKNQYLYWLNRLENSDWVPAAMMFYAKNKNNPAALDGFLGKLERLAAYMLVASFNVNSRIARYAQILSELEQSGCTSFSSIELSAEEKSDFLNILGSDVYLMTSARKKYILLRLDKFLASSSGASYDNKYLTIEHVLPQTVERGSYWEQKWPDAREREQWLHKIGNLIPLDQRTNSSASNYDFATKKSMYFFKNGVSPYVIGSQIAAITDWTPVVVAQRQSDLLNVFRHNWNL